MIEVKYVTKEDKNFWYSLDKYLPENEFDKKIRDKQGYVLFDDGVAVGLLRYNLFWDNTPFCTMLFIDWNNQKRDRPRFQTARFPEFWQSAIPANEGKKNAKTLGSCKPNAHWCANLKARARDRPRF